MPITMILLTLVLLTIAVFGAKLAMVFGFFLACARFAFPLGLIGLVAVGVTINFLLAPHHGADRPDY